MDEEAIKIVKQHRKGLYDVLQRVKTSGPSREVSLCVTNLQDAIGWLGTECERLGDPSPYPEEYNPQSAKIEPTADGLKL